MTEDDDAIANAIGTELREGLRSINSVGFLGGSVETSSEPLTGGTMFEIGGLFEACPGRRVYGTVEIDPGRIGWRLEANIWVYPDAERAEHKIADLGGNRVSAPDAACQQGRVLATRTWVALRDYLRACRDDPSAPTTA